MPLTDVETSKAGARAMKANAEATNTSAMATPARAFAIEDLATPIKALLCASNATASETPTRSSEAEMMSRALETGFSFTEKSRRQSAGGVAVKPKPTAYPRR
jgi:hypothetical protein